MSKLIVVTGGAGFIGTHLVKRLVSEGHRVISIDNYFTGSKDNHVPGAEYREGHTKEIADLIPESPDLVFHLGEYSRVQRSFEEPLLVFDLNTVGTFAVVEFCRVKKAKLVYAGSSTKFADGGGLGKNQSPYAFTKATNTELVCNYGEWYGLDFAITYFYNVYGPGERAGTYGTVVEIFRQRASKGEPLSVEEPGTQRRNFTHVDDIVNGLAVVGEKGRGDGYGIGHEQSVSILELANMFSDEVQMTPSRPGNRQSSALDTSKTRALGWEATHSLEEYIAEMKKENLHK